MELDSTGPGLSRRRFVVAGAALATTLIISPASTGWAAENSSTQTPFMQVSQLISPEPLSPITGDALHNALRQSDPGFDAQLQALAKTVAANPGITIESLVETLKQQQQQSQLKALNSMVAAWYTGIVDHRTYAYETALMYRPTRDALSPPSYTHGGPLNWANFKPTDAA